ncbi:hypothetical protein [Candidatus Hodarchaeum mangrovi]
MLGNSTCLTGIALKRSQFLSYQAFLRAIDFSYKYHKFVFIDYEGIGSLLDPLQLKTILKSTTGVVVLTIAARASEFHQQGRFLLENYLETLSSQRLLYCVVAGYPFYSTIDCKNSITDAIPNILERIRKRTNSLIFLGTENIPTKYIVKWMNSYQSIIPFMLHGDRRISTSVFNPPYGVYSPLTHIIADNYAIEYLIPYLLKRKEISKALAFYGYSPTSLSRLTWRCLNEREKTIITAGFQKYVLTSLNFQQCIKLFVKNKVRLIIANPAIKEFYEDLVRSFALGTALTINLLT